MKCNLCHRHWKHVRNLDHIVSICPDCFQSAGNPDKLDELKKLFEEIITHHVATVELRNVYRRHWDDIVAKNEQKQAK